MFGISFLELCTIFAVALVVLGPDKLPALARQLGKWSGNIQNAADSVKRELFNCADVPGRQAGCGPLSEPAKEASSSAAKEPKIQE